MSQPRQIVLASGNAGKLRELAQPLADLQIEVTPQSRYKVSDVAETGLTFIENAIIKARHASQQTGLPAIADDSGLEVDALNGQPGIYSARFAGAGCDDAANNAKLIEQLGELPDPERTARFQCTIVFMRHAADPVPLICQGSWEGRILFEPRGSNGFGYDPLFYVPTHDCSSAELTSEEKNRISHRALALQQLIALFSTSRATSAS